MHTDEADFFAHCLAAMDWFRAQGVKEMDESALRDAIGHLFRIVPIQRQRLHLPDSNIWWRGRRPKILGGHSNVAELIYPAISDKYGRAHVPGQQMLYASRNPTTVFSELNLKTNEQVQLIAIRVKRERLVRAEIVGEWEYNLNAGLSLLGADVSLKTFKQLATTLPPKVFYCALVCDAFFADMFSQRISEDKPEHYRATAFVAKHLLEQSDALMFPSVQKRGGLNIAVPAATFDASFEVLFSEVCSVFNLGYGVYAARPMRKSSGIDASGVIAWSSEASAEPGYTWSLEGGYKFPG